MILGLLSMNSLVVYIDYKDSESSFQGSCNCLLSVDPKNGLGASCSTHINVLQVVICVYVREYLAKDK